MKSNEIFLIIGLTVVITVLVTITTVKLTGNATVAWDDSIGGYPYTPRDSSAYESSVQVVEEKTVVEKRIIYDKSAVINLLQNAEIMDGISDLSCEDRCLGKVPGAMDLPSKEKQKECILAFYSDSINGAQLIDCYDKNKRNDNKQYKISCLCASSA